MKEALASRPDVSSLAMVAPTIEEAGALAPAGGNPAETMHVSHPIAAVEALSRSEQRRRAVLIGRAKEIT